MNASMFNGTYADSVGSALSLSKIEFVINMTCTLIGIPLNVIVAMLIICSGNRRSYHIFTVGVLFSNVYTLSTALLDYAVTYWPLDALCFVYYSTFGSSYTLLLLNVLLATLDRWSSLVVPQWRRSNITIFRLIILQVVAFVLISVLIDLPYIVRFVPLQCAIHIDVVKWMAFIDCPLMAACIALKLILYRASKSCANHEEVITPIISIVLTTIFGPAYSINDQRVDEENCIGRSHSRRLSWQVTSWQGVEREGRISLISGMISMFIFAIPSAVVFIYAWVCDDALGDCGSIESITSSVAIFWYIHAVYNCIVILVRNPHVFSTMNILRRPALPIFK